jgi:transmembrane sensor
LPAHVFSSTRSSAVNKIGNNQAESVLPESVRAEAAVWLARLHSDARSRHTEQSFKRWLAADPANAAAFERLTTTWELAGSVRLAPEPRRPLDLWRLFRAGLRASAATLAVCVVITLGALYLLRSDSASPQQVAETGIGERRSLRLADGSYLTLNTDSRVSVRYREDMRLVTLEKGQAHFDVAEMPGRPFVVQAGGKRIVALGTAFDVRWTDSQLSIVLLKGRVAVTSTSPLPADEAREAILLVPGERLHFEEATRPVKSRTPVDREAAWMSGRAIFDSTPLPTAVAEINRYAVRPIRLADGSLAELRISGTFAVDDPAAFARALGDIFSLDVTVSRDAIVLAPRLK